MYKTIIKIKENKNGLVEQVIAITNVNNITIYNYYDGKNLDAKKSTFNKYVMIEYLKSVQVPKKYIKQVENI